MCPLCFLWYFSICKNKEDLWKDFKADGRSGEWGQVQSHQVSHWNAAQWSLFHQPTSLPLPLCLLLLLLLLLLKHDFTGPSQFSQFDLGIFRSVQCHLTVLSGWVSGAFMRLTCSYLCEVADLATQFILHAVNGALELDQLSVQEAGIVFVFGEFQNYITGTLQDHRYLLLDLLQSSETLVSHE